MYLALKIFNYQKSEKGFVLIAAIMAVMIMLAVSFFILTTSTQDIRISARLVGERKAMSAAEAGAMALYASAADLATLAANIPVSVQVDPLNDPSTSYIHRQCSALLLPARTLITAHRHKLKSGCHPHRFRVILIMGTREQVEDDPVRDKM
jgi:hypothetical protein